MKHNAAYLAITYWKSVYNYLGTSADSILNVRWSDVFGILSMAIWRIECWIPKATDIHSDYIILMAFLRQQWLHERDSMLLLYIHCLPCYCDISFFLWKLTMKLKFACFQASATKCERTGLLHNSQFFYFNTCTVNFFIILYYDQQIHNYFTNYHNPRCFDTIVSSSGNV
jgi:hypothetical protein